MPKRWITIWREVILPSLPFYIVMAISPFWCVGMVTIILAQSPHAWQDVLSIALIVVSTIFVWVAGIFIGWRRWQWFLDDCLDALRPPSPPDPPAPIP